MATYTENYTLTMPEESDYYTIEDFNGNFETIDTLMAENERAAAEINEKIGTPENDETIFSLLQHSGGSLIKSIQTITVKHSTATASESVWDIAEVDPAKCIILLNRLGDSTSGKVFISYALAGNTLTVNTSASSSGAVELQFQIIEFI